MWQIATFTDSIDGYRSRETEKKLNALEQINQPTRPRERGEGSPHTSGHPRHQSSATAKKGYFSQCIDKWLLALPFAWQLCCCRLKRVTELSTLRKTRPSLGFAPACQRRRTELLLLLLWWWPSSENDRSKPKPRTRRDAIYAASSNRAPSMDDGSGAQQMVKSQHSLLSSPSRSLEGANATSPAAYLPWPLPLCVCRARGHRRLLSHEYHRRLKRDRGTSRGRC